MYNYSKLLGKIKEIYGTQQNFAQALGMAYSSLNLKLNGKAEFNQNQIKKACSLLGVSLSEAAIYFFETDVRKTKHNNDD